MKTILKKIINDPINLAKLLNTLSLLEYIGARKILKSQQQENIDEEILAHAIEELRHAFVLKKSARKIMPDLCNNYSPNELLCGTAAVNYFQIIDQAVAQQLGNNNPLQAYLYTTFLIETRAIEVYHLFEAILAELNKPSIFRGIITEEDRHLTEIINRLQSDVTFANNINFLTALEQNAFNHLIKIIGNSI